jgi:hypothetical protein
MYFDEPKPDVLPAAALMVSPTVEGFRSAFKKLAADNSLRKKLSEQSIRAFQPIRGSVMERKERALYQSVIVP